MLWIIIGVLIIIFFGYKWILEGDGEYLGIASALLSCFLVIILGIWEAEQLV